MLTYETWEENVVSFSEEDETKGALSVLNWAYKEYKDEVVYACSFGVEGMVLLHIINQVNPSAKVVFLDTNVHFQETYELIQKVRTISFIEYYRKQPELTLDEQAKLHGEKLWESNPNLCCKIRKILPLEKSLVVEKHGYRA